MSKFDDFIRKNNINVKNLYKCLKYKAFQQHYQLSPALLEIRLLDNISRLKGKELSVADNVDKKIVEKFNLSELNSLLLLVMNKDLEKEIFELFNLLDRKKR